MICVEFRIGQLTSKEARNALREYRSLKIIEPEHAEEVEELLDYLEQQQEEAMESDKKEEDDVV